jgi:hypothetical protein
VLYGLKQASRAWYEHLHNFLIENGFKIGTIDTTLFIKKHGSDIFIYPIYHCKEFGEIMLKEFEMLMIGELTFFLGFQVKQMINMIRTISNIILSIAYTSATVD